MVNYVNVGYPFSFDVAMLSVLAWTSFTYFVLLKKA